MKDKVSEHIKNCTKCIAFSRTPGKIKGFVRSIPKEKVPFDTIHVNHFSPINRDKTTKKYVFLVVDAFTKHVKLYAVKSTTSRETIQCLKDYFNTYSGPRILISDRRTCFTSK